MNRSRGGIFDEPTVGEAPRACTSDGRAACSFCITVIGLAAGRGAKTSLTTCEIEVFLSLAPGHCVVVLDHEIGGVWRGAVDVPFPEQGFVWAFRDPGMRKLVDISVHTVWRSAMPEACGHGSSEAGNGRVCDSNTVPSASSSGH